MSTLEQLKEIHREARAKRSELEKVRNMEICQLRYKDGLTYQAIGTRYGLTRERVRQIINQTLK